MWEQRGGVMPASELARPLRILVVDDSPSDVRLIREALKETAVNVTLITAWDGVEATEYLQKTLLGEFPRPDLIILDLNLPRKGGREVLAEVKTDIRLRQIPVIVMTSSSAGEDVTYAYNLNANSYITKPADLTEYLTVVRALQVFWFHAVKLPPDDLPALPIPEPGIRTAILQ
jgi:two-component system, chemotaxis family, response regulator Rcp1